MYIEKEIAEYLIDCAKFEYFLINENLNLGIERDIDGLKKVEGLNWTKLARLIEEKKKFKYFDFCNSGFSFLIEESPQFLVKHAGRLKWDSNQVDIDSWEKLLTRSFAQLRNNIAHGNKSHMPSQFTQDRTEKFITAGRSLMNFIASEVFEIKQWREPIQFQ